MRPITPVRPHDAEGPERAGAASAAFYSHEDGQIVLRFEGNAAENLSQRYLRNPAAVDQLLAAENVTSLSSPGEIYWPLADYLGSLRDIATYNAGTNTTTVANHRGIDSFGVITSENNAAIDLLFAFTGRLLDESTGLQNNWHRWYDPRMGQWISEDPIGRGWGV